MANRIKTTKKAQREASTIAKVDSIAGTSAVDVEFVEQGDVLAWAAGKFIARVDGNISEGGHSTGGSSVGLNIQEASKDRLVITAPVHLIILDKGVNGTEVKYNDGPGYTTKKPPVEPIIEWIKKKNLVTGTTDGKGKAFKDKDTADTSMAYAIRETIFREGRPPTYVYTNEIPQLINDIANNVAGLTVKQVFDQFNKKFNSK